MEAVALNALCFRENDKSGGVDLQNFGLEDFGFAFLQGTEEHLLGGVGIHTLYIDLCYTAGRGMDQLIFELTNVFLIVVSEGEKKGTESFI